MKTEKMTFGINYIDTGSALHALNGITKFLLFIGWVTVVLTTFDLRILVTMIALGIGLLVSTRVPVKVYRSLLIGTGTVLLLNALFMYLLSPSLGSDAIGTRHVLLSLPGDYSLTEETLFYLITVTIKYFSMFPIALVFVFTTHPTEFAASLNRLGLPYKIAYAVSLTLRYLPEVKKDYINIMHAQQARGVELSNKAPLITRLKNLAKILGPLIFSSLDRADDISNAMTLRGFGRHKTRSWYSLKPLNRQDKLWIGIIVIIVVLALIKRFTAAELFWYPLS
ncbi:energy-coupling factor transporter transmembrane component T family protein [Vibrio nitrifigilis]|uniref:Energy-coupling factor transporter transmembrane protein EcfT n=1 Tax=Vibrio nitrifigilis TaxID=2789781 RepID=A0ABS0GM15_9VIBR|nr:energy-coupling factor transporter transmembrane component T [Vibrio nitrifigilis]MBF9003478.1 energy-coupling factor transporter transmembrane protein EcfT [Vibrio nitrifigilis]